VLTRPKAIQLKPDYALAYNNLGFTKKDKGDLDGAMIAFNKAIELKPDGAEAYINRSWVRYEQGDSTGAFEDSKKALALTTVNSLVGIQSQGMIYFINMDYQKAIASWEQAILLYASSKQSLQPWIEKAKTKQNS